MSLNEGGEIGEQLSLNESKRLFGLPIPIEPEEKSLMIAIGWSLRCDIADFALMLLLDSDPMLKAFRNILLNHSSELLNDITMRKR